MSNDQMVVTPSPATSRVAPAPLFPSCDRKPPIVLDMGEASRAQGFRLNGCR